VLTIELHSPALQCSSTHGEYLLKSILNHCEMLFKYFEHCLKVEVIKTWETLKCRRKTISDTLSIKRKLREI